MGTKASPVQTLRLHPLIRERLGVVDLRRMRILAVEDGLVVDLVLENHPRPWPRLSRELPARRAA